MSARLAAGLVISALLLSAGVARAVEPDLSDPDTYAYAQRYLLLQLNQLRGRAGVGRVELDPLACQAAKQHATEMLSGRYLSHWNRQGLKPTRRYNLLGGYHSLGENVYRQRGGGGSLEERLQLMLDTLLQSEGHSQTMLGPNYTHVGLGFALSSDGRDFYGVQEFIVRVGGEYECPLSARVGETVEFSGRFDPRVFGLAYLVVGYEELPVPRDREWLSLTESYRDADKLVAGYAPDALQNFEGLETFHDIQVDSRQGWFRCPVRLDYKSREGLYYLFVWLTRRQTGEAVLAAVAAVEVTE
jgi:hypothetical protein